jgi:hypothetical protein
VEAALRIARALPFDQVSDAGRDKLAIEARRATLRTAGVRELQVWQRAWWEGQKRSLADYFARQGNPEAASSCLAEAPFFPMVPAPELVD